MVGLTWEPGGFFGPLRKEEQGLDLVLVNGHRPYCIVEKTVVTLVPDQ